MPGAPAIRTSLDTQGKLEILSAASQYDLACACGTNDRDRRKRGAGGTWLYPVSLPSGGTSVMLKTLLSNACTNDCKYCPYRSDADVKRVTIAPEEIARVFMEYLHGRQVFGLFLSSGVMGNPDASMEQMNAAARILRGQYRFRGYIHLKVIPGASDAAIEETLRLASAVSINIETPGEEHCKKLSGCKRYLEDIIRPLKLISRETAPGAPHARVKQTTQFIVGASDETDAEIVKYTCGLYGRLGLDRVYFSAYQRGLGEPDIPGERSAASGPELLTREHRLYQVDFLLRKYGFAEEDLAFDERGFLSLARDPKQVWADRHPEFFPVRVATATRDALLRVPGIGPVAADRIVKGRRAGRIRDPREIKVTGARREKMRAYLLFE